MMKVIKGFQNRLDFLVCEYTKLPFLLFNVTFTAVLVFGQNTISFPLLIFLVFSMYAVLKMNFRVLCVYVLAILFGVFRVLWFQMQEKSFKQIEWFYGNDVKIEGTIISEPEKVPSGYRFEIDKIEVVVNTDQSTALSKTKGRLLVIQRSVETPAFGNRIEIHGSIIEPKEDKQFSYKSYLRAKGIYGTVNVESLKIVSTDEVSGILIWLHKTKQKMIDNINLSFPPLQADLFAGVVFGARSNLDSSFKQDLQNTGTSHIVAVSGYNINLIILFLMTFAPIWGRKPMQIFSIMFIVLFMIFVGIENIPVVRASLMGIVVTIASLIGRKGAFQVLISFLVALMIFQNPLCFQTISFQLSFLSTIGLVLFGKTTENLISWIKVDFFRESLSATLTAIIVTLPITLMNFGTFSYIAPVVNLIVLPIIPIVTISGVLFLPVFSFSIFISRLFGLLFWFPLKFLQVVIHFFSTLFPAITISDGISTYVSGLLIVMILIGAVELTYKKHVNANTKYC